MISGVVLAAGTGSRFGGTKQLARYEGKPLVQHAIDALGSAALREIVIVTGHDAEAVESVIRLPPQARFVRNPNYRDGQSTSIAAGLSALDESSEGAVILLADQPGVTDAEVRALIDRFHETRARIVRISYVNGPGPALLSREVYAPASHLHGDSGARVLMASHPEWVEEVAVPFAAPPDIDEPSDL